MAQQWCGNAPMGEEGCVQPGEVLLAKGLLLDLRMRWLAGEGQC
jgi:hypothetical protein